MPIEPPLVLDTDFLSSFAWVDRLNILECLYSRQMIVLEEVMLEISKVEHLEIRVEKCLRSGSIRRCFVFANSAEALELARFIEAGKYGRGESACMAYLMHNPGTMGSNNLSDVSMFCKNNNKMLLCTGDCLCDAVNYSVITLSEGDDIWQKMKRWQKLPNDSLSEYKSSYGK